LAPTPARDGRLVVVARRARRLLHDDTLILSSEPLSEDNAFDLAAIEARDGKPFVSTGSLPPSERVRDLVTEAHER